MILDTGTIVKNVKVRWGGDYMVNMVLKSPPIKNGNRS
jgi:hypothetical protein